MALLKKITKVFKKSEKKKKDNKNNNLSLPSYMIISDKEKEKMVYSITITMKMLEGQYNDQDNEEKKVFDLRLNDVDKVIDLIKKKAISIVANNEISREVNNLSDKNNRDIINRIDVFNKKVIAIINNIDNDFLNIVVNQYNVVNYVTISTVIIDKNYEILSILEDDYQKHRFNKSYYERELNNIKHELKVIKEIKYYPKVQDSIILLKKDLYTKSIDKYDLLYSNELFVSFNNACDRLINNIEAKVVDLNKEPKDDDKHAIKAISRFQDLELAHNLIIKLLDIKIDDISNYINDIYNRFNNGIKNKFNYNTNKNKTELVILYNELNIAINKLCGESYIFLYHINFRMRDLLEAIQVKQEELSILLKDKNIIINNTIDNKIMLLNKKNKE